MSDNINIKSQSTDPPAEPLTREEQYLSAIAGVTSSEDIPEKPLTREEKYLNKIVENGGGGGGGGFTPTDEQLAAMNSGITAEDVEQIDTNKNNISKLMPTAYIQPRMETAYNITLLWGGYAKVGNLCVINMRVNVGSEVVHGNFFIHDLPTPLGSASLSIGHSFVMLANNRMQKIAVALDSGSTTQGYNSGIANVESIDGIATGTLAITGVYLCE